jgi:hypothetical protein
LFDFPGGIPTPEPYLSHHITHTIKRFIGRCADSGIGGSRTPVIGGTGAAGDAAVPELPKRDKHVRVIAQT